MDQDKLKKILNQIYYDLENMKEDINENRKIDEIEEKVEWLIIKINKEGLEGGE